jgi:hypothetical protein
MSQEMEITGRETLSTDEGKLKYSHYTLSVLLYSFFRFHPILSFRRFTSLEPVAYSTPGMTIHPRLRLSCHFLEQKS